MAESLSVKEIVNQAAHLSSNSSYDGTEKCRGRTLTNHPQLVIGSQKRERHSGPVLKNQHSTGVLRTGMWNSRILKWKSQTFWKTKCMN